MEARRRRLAIAAEVGRTGRAKSPKAARHALPCQGAGAKLGALPTAQKKAWLTEAWRTKARPFWPCYRALCLRLVKLSEAHGGHSWW